MNNIFTDAERQEKKKFREERVNKIISVGKETGKVISKGSQYVSKGVRKGIELGGKNPSLDFSGGKEIKAKAIRRFASSGSSKLHVKGSFEDVKERFGRFE